MTRKKLVVASILLVAVGALSGWAYSRATRASRLRREEVANFDTLGLGKRPARPALPDASDASSAKSWPSKEELGAYSLHIGATDDVSDDDARWLLDIVQHHPEPSVRVATVSLLNLAFGEDRAGELRPSHATQATKDAITMELIVWLSSKSSEQRLHAAIAVCTGRLWRDPVFRSALEGLRNDPDEALQRWMKLCWNEVDQAK